MVVLAGTDLTLEALWDVAHSRVQVRSHPEALARVMACHERVAEWSTAGEPIYGVNTGFGDLISVLISQGASDTHQRNLLRSHAAGGGRSFDASAVRAGIAVRANSLLRGFSGVSPEAVTLLLEFLNRAIHPIVPEQGSLGASGDLAPLAHIALALVGEGEAEYAGERVPSMEALRREFLEPLSHLGPKEGLGLINGTSMSAGLLALQVRRAEHLLDRALQISASYVQALRAPTTPFDEAGNNAKLHPGQRQIAARLRDLLRDSQLSLPQDHLLEKLRTAAASTANAVDTGIFLQQAYSARCIPQILGPVIEALAFCRQVAQREINSASDNPLLFETPAATFHGGNFHGQYVGVAADFLSIAVTEIGVLAERQLNRLLDGRLNGDLPPFLIRRDPGLYSGLEGAQYLATSLASENLGLAAPASVRSLPSNAENQDVVSMSLTAARKCRDIIANVERILAVETFACIQAFGLRDGKGYSAPVAAFLETIKAANPIYEDQEPVAQVVESIRERLFETH